jgi:hypothetical protein
MGGDDVNYKNPTYRQVCSGRTGHAESVEVRWSKDKITFEELVEVSLDQPQLISLRFSTSILCYAIPYSFIIGIDQTAI